MLPSASSQEIPSTVIRVRDLRCGYPGHEVIRGVSFDVMRGEFVGILGPNGSGKTTLLLALGGILPILEGEVGIHGSPLGKFKPKDLARRMAALCQNPEIRFPFPCEEIVHMGRYPHQKRWQMENPYDAAIVKRSMEITDTLDLSGRLITALSGGEQQRVLMAKALAQDTPILLLDEATSAMDIHRKLQIFQVLERLSSEKELTVLTVLHDVNTAALFCRRMIFLKEGVMVADGPTEEVLTEETLEVVYRTRVLIYEPEGTGKRQVVFLPGRVERS